MLATAAVLWTVALFSALQSPQPPAAMLSFVPKLLRLAWPVTLARLGIMGMGLCDVIVVGQLAPAELSHQALGWSFTGVALVTGIGAQLRHPWRPRIALHGVLRGNREHHVPRGAGNSGCSRLGKALSAGDLVRPPARAVRALRSRPPVIARPRRHAGSGRSVPPVRSSFRAVLR